MLAVNNLLPSKILSSPENFGALTIQVFCSNKVFTLCLLYIPPRADHEYQQGILNFLPTLSVYDNLILMGDLNLPDVNWESLSGSTAFSSRLCEIIFDLNLTQLISQPTHTAGNILDVVFTSFDINNIPNVISSLPCNLCSDHYLITFTIPTSMTKPKSSNSGWVYDYSKADWEGVFSFIDNYNFDLYLQSSDIELLWAELRQVLLNAVESFIPKVYQRKHQRPKWFTSQVQHELNRVHSLRRRARAQPSETNNAKLATAETNLQTLMEEAKHSYESCLINTYAMSNNSQIFKYISSLTHNNSIPEVMSDGSNSSCTDYFKACMFNDFFYSVFAKNTSDAETSVTCSVNDSDSLHNILISTADVYENLISLDPNKATGIDNISPKILKHCAIPLSGPICHLFQQCFLNGYLPQEWRTHCVIPIFKSGDKTLVSNYRPVSLLCIISKVLEKIVFKVTYNYLSNTFSLHQFGFLPGRSTLQQLIVFINNLLEAKSSSLMVDVIYLDFRKAFDSVPHSKLLGKLRSYGITGTLWKWFQAYLSHRTQYVRINNILSHPVNVTSGVPQGSILGPLLFALYINDLPSCLTSAIPFIYADDTKCVKSISTVDDIHSLQEDLDRVFHWSCNTQLFFNESKFAHICFWSKPIFNDFSVYHINNKAISKVDSIKDLGIILSSNMNWDCHYKQIINKAYKVLGLLRRNFSTDSIIAKKHLYISIVRSQLLYCSQVWRPYLIKDILLFERIQRRATKYILNDYTSSYKSRLLKLNFLPLMYTFELNDLTFFIKSYKSPSQHFNINDYMKFRISNTRSSTYHKLIHQRSSSNLSRHFYFCRLPRLWNSLPPIDLTLPVSTITSFLKQFLWSHFTKNFNDDNICTFHYLCPCYRCSGYPRPHS